MRMGASPHPSLGQALRTKEEPRVVTKSILSLMKKIKTAFDLRYSKGKDNLNAARSSEGKNGLMEFYGVDPTLMAAHLVLGITKFRRIYIINPRYTNWLELLKKEKEEAASGAIQEKMKTLIQEEEEQKKKDVIQQNKEYLELVMKNAVKMINHDS